MTEYTVIWAIEVEAFCPEEAAELAQKLQRDPESKANQFYVEHGSERFDIDLDSKEFLEKKLSVVNAEIACLENGDDFLYTNRNGNLPRFNALREQAADIKERLKEWNS